MKCQKCAKHAIVHLTEIVTDAPALLGGATKRAMEIHLCLSHAVEAGLVVASAQVPPEVLAMQSPGTTPNDQAHVKNPTAIVPAPAEGGGLTVVRGRNAGDSLECPACGMSWNNFKQGGLVGCPHDYELFSHKMLPLLKRAQEGATEHVGKVAPRKKTVESERQVATLRLRRDLQKAVNAENYEQAATLRDQLRRLEEN